MSYKKLEIWQLSRESVIMIHSMTLTDLPKHEMYELGSQIRRSSESIKANIVEGYGRRQYKQDFIKFLVYAIASRDETIDHLETLYEVGSLQNKEKYEKIHSLLDLLGKKLGHFLKTVQVSHNSEKNNID